MRLGVHVQNFPEKFISMGQPKNAEATHMGAVKRAVHVSGITPSILCRDIDEQK